MSAVDRRGPPEPHWETRPSRNQDLEYPRRLLPRPRHPISRSTWLPDGSRSAQHVHRNPIYVSFVRKAILWDRGVCHSTVHHRPDHHPSLCPRFLSHMKYRPEDIRPPCSLISKSRPPPPSQGKSPTWHALTAPKTHTPAGCFSLSPDRRRNPVQVAGRRSAVAVPCPPPSPTINPTPPPHPNTPHLNPNTPHLNSVRQRNKPKTVLTSPSDTPALEEKEEVQERQNAAQPAVVSVTESDWKLLPGLSGPELSPRPASTVSHGSLSDLSRPPSSLFSRSTDLSSGRSSVLSGADLRDLEPEGSVCFSPLQPRPPLAPDPPAGSNPCQLSTNATATPLLYEPVFGKTKPLSPRPMSGVLPQSDKPPSRPVSSQTTEHLHPYESVAPDLHPSTDSVTLAFPSTTWSSCPSPQRTTPRSISEPKLTPTASATRLASQHWAVLPPISPVRGRCGSAASHYSELSCSQSHVFDELEAIAPRSTSCLSLDPPSGSSCCPSINKELSPGLAALTVGCDSGNLGSLSRVQLLLLNRPEPETFPSPFDLQEEGLSPVEDWSDLRMPYDAAGVLRPLTAGSVSERCDSAGKVQENKSDQSEGGSGSPSSWIIDQSPSCNMFRSAHSPCVSSHGSSTDEGGPTEEEANYPGWGDQDGSSAGGRRPGSPRDQRTEERKTKVLNLLSKLQDEAPRQPNSNKGRSNFEDFDFLAKYCIFSEEKLAEYKRAFEAEDSDGDGYLSCLQALLALRNVLPSELLSDEEEIYVCRILEMVDFRVTDGLVDLRLFAVIASLAQKIATMDEFMRTLITDMDFRSLEVRLFKAKQLFLFLLEEQRGVAGTQQGFISAEQLLLELKAGGIHLEQEAAVRLELQHIPPLDLLDFLAYLPLFMLIHKSVISNPLNDPNDV